VLADLVVQRPGVALDRVLGRGVDGTRRARPDQHPAGSTAARISALHRVVPVRIFDRIVRRFNRMPS
jgi:hypothetical protein